MCVQESVRKGAEMKLGDALANAEKLYDDGCDDASDLYVALADLIDAIEAHLEAERKSAEMLLGLADLRRHGGD